MTNALFAATLLPLLFSLILDKIYGVLSFPVAPSLRAFSTASAMMALILELGISCSAGMGLQNN